MINFKNRLACFRRKSGPDWPTLIEELDSSVEVNTEELWNAEAQRRYEAYLKKEIASRPGDEVMDRARSQLK